MLARPVRYTLRLALLGAGALLSGIVALAPVAAQSPPSSAPSAAQAQPALARAVTVRGQAAWRRSGTQVWQRLQPGTELGPGDELMTWDAASVVVELAEGHRVELGPNTQVQVAQLQPSQAPGQKGGVSRLRVWLGKVWSTVGDLLGTESRFEVETDSAVAAVRGTEFFVEQAATGESLVVVRDGRVLVEAFGQTVELMPGYGLQITPEQPLPQPQPMEYPAPPSQLPPEQPPEQPQPQQPQPPQQPPAPAPPAPTAGGVPLSLTSESIAGFAVQSLGFHPTVRLGPAEASLDLRIYYSQRGDRVGFLLDRHTAEIIDPSSNRLPDALPSLIRWIQWETRSFGLRWGRLDPVTVGEGILVNRYWMMDETGLRLRVDMGRLGLFALVPTNATTNVMAARLAWRPSGSGSVEVGLQGAVERRPIAGRNEPGPLQAAAVDVVYPLGTLGLYAQVAAMQPQPAAPGQNPRAGASAGLRGQLGTLGWRAEYRAGRGFPFGYFHGLYEWYSQGDPARLARLDLPLTDDEINGYMAELSFQLPFIRGVEASAEYEQYAGRDGRLGAGLNFTLPNGLAGQVRYLQSPVPSNEPFRWDAPTARITANLRLPVRQGFTLVMRREQFFGSAQDSTFQVTTEFSL